MESNLTKEIIFTQKLAHADEKIRCKACKDLKKYIEIKSKREGFNYEEYKNIWKGLYYYMYAADKPLFQETVAEKISNIINKVSSSAQKALFFQAALDTYAREWTGMDKFRFDKFLMLFSRILRKTLYYLRNENWNPKEMNTFIKIMEESIICPSDHTNSKPLGLKMQLADTILEELAKTGGENLKHSVIISFIYPFLKVIAISKIESYVSYIEEKILRYLMRQSDVGLENLEDLTINEVLHLDPESSDDEQELDPRAGSVNTYLPQLKPDYEKLSILLQALGSCKGIPSKKRSIFYSFGRKFLDLTEGENPLISRFEEEALAFEKGIVLNKEKLTLGDNGSKIKKRSKKWKKKNAGKKTKDQPLAPTQICLDSVVLEAVQSVASEVGLPSEVVQMPKANSNKKSKKKKFVPEENGTSPEPSKKKSKKKSELKVVNSTLIEYNANKISSVSENKEECVSEMKPKETSIKKIKKAKKKKTPQESSNSDPWKEPLQEGEVEVFVETKNEKKKRKKKSPKIEMVIKKTANVNTKGKTLKINLLKNTEYSFQDYKRDLNASPGIPFSAKVKPRISVLKTPSPSSAKPHIKKHLKRLQAFGRI